MSSMAKQKQEPARGGFWLELFQFGLYKPNQGRVVRQVTFLTIALLACLVAWEVKRSAFLSGMGASGYLVMFALAAVQIWIAYRVVNYSVFADFLIAVEAEMNKVSWPTRKELWGASLVVMFVIFSMAAFLLTPFLKLHVTTDTLARPYLCAVMRLVLQLYAISNYYTNMH